VGGCPGTANFLVAGNIVTSAQRMVARKYLGTCELYAQRNPS
jgi:hypothetical protein